MESECLTRPGAVPGLTAWPYLGTLLAFPAGCRAG